MVFGWNGMRSFGGCIFFMFWLLIRGLLNLKFVRGVWYYWLKIIVLMRS